MNFHSLRRFDKIHTIDFTLFVLSLFLLLFAVRFGSLFFFLFSNVLDYDFANALYKINLPYAHFDKKERPNRLYYATISIQNDGTFRYDGRTVSETELESELDNLIITHFGKDVLDEVKLGKEISINKIPYYKLSLPVSLNLIIDRDCKMLYVYNLYDKLRKRRIREAFHYTNRFITSVPR